MAGIWMILAAKSSVFSELFTRIPNFAPVSLRKDFKGPSIRWVTLVPSLITMGIKPKGPSIIKSISDLSRVR